VKDYNNNATTDDDNDKPASRPALLRQATKRVKSKQIKWTKQPLPPLALSLSSKKKASSKYFDSDSTTTDVNCEATKATSSSWLLAK